MRGLSARVGPDPSPAIGRPHAAARDGLISAQISDRALLPSFCKALPAACFADLSLFGQVLKIDHLLSTRFCIIERRKDYMAHHGEPTREEWRELARQASQEEDPERVIDLSKQIIEKFDEEKRRKESARSGRN
jgi:hypothetical protein